MEIAKDNRHLNVAGVEEEVDQLVSSSISDLLPHEAVGKKKAAKAKISVAAFAGIYQKGVRQAMLSAAALLKLFRRGDLSNGITQAVAFLDMVTGGDVPVT